MNDDSQSLIALEMFGSEVVEVPVSALKLYIPLRLHGTDPEHVTMLSENWAQLPPITVHQKTMKVVDGMHRLEAAKALAKSNIKATFVGGSEADAFLLALSLNGRHGLPLSGADRRAVVERLLQDHPGWSDRRIARLAGVAHTTVAAVQARSDNPSTRLSARVGTDLRVRPQDAVQRRQRAAELLEAQPEATLRTIAKAAGVSAATVIDVRRRTARGLSPVPDGLIMRRQAHPNPPEADAPSHPTELTPAPPGVVPVAPGTDPITLGPATLPPTGKDPEKPTSATSRGPVREYSVRLDTLRRDPSLRSTMTGRMILRLLSATMSISNREQLASSVPAHIRARVAELSRQSANSWLALADELERGVVPERGR